MNPPTRNKRKIVPISSHCALRNNDDDDDDDDDLPVVKIQSFRDSNNKKDEEYALNEGVKINTGESKKQSLAILSFLIFVVDCIVKCLATIFNKKLTGRRRGRRAGATTGSCSTQDNITIVNNDYTIPATVHNNRTEDTSKEKSDQEERGYSSYLYHSSKTEDDEERGTYEKQEQGPLRAYTSGTIRTDHHEEEGHLSSEKEGAQVHDRWIAYGQVSNGHENVDEQDGVVCTDQLVSEGDYIHGQVVQGERTQQVRSNVTFNWLDRLRDDLDSGLHAQRSIYKGDFRHGKCHGYGKMTWYDGGWYVGEWRDGTMHGYGKELRPDGSLRHDGEWSQGHPIRAYATAGSILSASELIANGSDDETVLVTKKQILDSYGQKVGVYTGEQSKSTGRPHGKGCLEYKQEAGSCERDSSQGLMKGHDGLSMSDGDIDEDGLENHSNDAIADSTLKASEHLAGLQELVTTDVVLAQKDQANMRLRQELNECQEQLAILHAMVRRLKVDIDNSARDPDGTDKRKKRKSPPQPKNKNVESSSEDDDSEDEESPSGEEEEEEEDKDQEEDGEWSHACLRAGQRTTRDDTINQVSAVPLESDPSEGESEDEADILTDILLVTDQQIIDPYGEKGVYTGALSKSSGMPNGEGRLEYEKEGRWYEGDWIHGRWTGYGRLSNGDGDFYEGGLKNDQKHGTGVMRFADGRVFEGEYIRGQMIQGRMTYQDGSDYVGSWVDGMRHGRGKCIFVDGSEYEGEFREGNFHGHGRMTWNDGGWYVGEWSDGEMHGRGKEIRPDGSLRHEGEWARGHPIRRSHGK